MNQMKGIIILIGLQGLQIMKLWEFMLLAYIQDIQVIVMQKKLVRFAIEYAKQNHQKAIRLDFLKGNIPAERLYSSMGFKYLHILQMYY